MTLAYVRLDRGGNMFGSLGTGGSAVRLPGVGDININADALAARIQAGGLNPGLATEALRDAIADAGGNWEDYAEAAVESGCAAALASVGASGLCSLVGPIWDGIVGAIRQWITIKIDPNSDFLNWAAGSVGIETGRGAAPALRGAGYDPVYFHKDLAARTAFIERRQSALGWRPYDVWQRAYGSSYQWGSGVGTYYGALYRLSDLSEASRVLLRRATCRTIRLPRLSAAAWRAEGGAVPADERAIWSAGISDTVLSRLGTSEMATQCGAVGVPIPTQIAPDSQMCRGPVARGVDLALVEARRRELCRPRVSGLMRPPGWILPGTALGLRPKSEGMSSGTKTMLIVGAVVLAGGAYWYFTRGR